MAKVTRTNPISSTVSDEERKLLEELDKVLKVSRAEFIRDVVMREAHKYIKNNKK